MTSGLPCPLCEGPDRRGSLERSLRVLAVDDEAPALEDLVYLLRCDPRIAHVEAVTDATKAEMKRILGEIQDGTFAREFIAEDDNGRPNFEKYRAEAAAHPIEEVGTRLRGLMAWIKN